MKGLSTGQQVMSQVPEGVCKGSWYCQMEQGYRDCSTAPVSGNHFVSLGTMSTRVILQTFGGF